MEPDYYYGPNKPHTAPTLTPLAALADPTYPGGPTHPPTARSYALTPIAGCHIRDRRLGRYAGAHMSLACVARGDMLVCKCHLACVGPGPGTTDAWMYARSPVCEGGDENATKKGEILSGCDRGPSLESSRHGSEYI